MYGPSPRETCTLKWAAGASSFPLRHVVAVRRRGSDHFPFRPYRAPELLFGVRTYDATAIDLWALGATFAEFFTTLHCHRALADDFDDFDDDDADSSERGDPTKAYLFDELPGPWARSEWERYSLFDGSRGDIGLAWSIFRTRGSPTPENWPVRFVFHPSSRRPHLIFDQTFTDLPDANKINFIDSPGVHLSTLLPHLEGPRPDVKQIHFPPADLEPTALDLIQRLLVYPPESRFKAADSLKHPWLLGDGPLVLPQAALASDDVPTYAVEVRDGRTAGEWLRAFLTPSQQSRRKAAGD